MKSILVQFPTRSRPTKFLRTLEMWMDPTVNFHVVIDEDDRSMNNPAMMAELHSRGITDISVIPRCGKHGAMNYGISSRPGDIIVLAQDDMIPVNNYARIIRQAWDRHFKDSTDGVLHPSDGRRNDGLNTIVIMGREYYNRFGYIYHESYKGIWADNEYTDVSVSLGKCVRLKQVIMFHDWNGGAPDELLKHNESFWNVDKANYRYRQMLGFPKE